MGMWHHEDPAGGPFSDLPPEAGDGGIWSVALVIVIGIVGAILLSAWAACESQMC